MPQAVPRPEPYPQPATAGQPNRRPVREVESRDLLGDADELLIRHNDSVYRLRLTRQDKLILTK